MAVITYKCPNCGGDLRFDPASQQYQCQYCRSDFSQEQLEQMPGGSEPEQAAAAGQGDALLYNCPSCGAEIVTDETTAATFCYYCHNPVVLSGKMQGAYHPDQIIPFAVEKTKALEIFSQWIGRKKYLPKAFYSQDQIEKMTGIYFPYWLYNCKVDGKLDAEATKRKTWVSGNVQFVQTEKFDVSREGQMPVEHVTRNALKKANRQLVEGVLPFEMEGLQSFSMGYLSGFQAENRDMDQKDFTYEVEQEVREYAEGSLKNEIGAYDSVTVRSQTAEITDAEWKYALMPVWTLTYKDTKTDKIYYFACNGQTGKVCGELPVDNVRLLTLFASICIPLLVILLIVGYFL